MRALAVELWKLFYLHSNFTEHSGKQSYQQYSITGSENALASDERQNIIWIHSRVYRYV